MSTSVVTSPGPTRGDSSQNGLWLRSKPWDMCCLTGSSLFVVLPLLLYAQVGRAAIVVNLVVAGLVGGPHMYATFFRTFGDSAFRRGYRVLLLSSLGIPALVIAGAVWHFQLLLTLFFFWASLHVLHQIVYILACYERKQPQPPPPWSRAIDYAVVCSSLYPLASYHLVHDTFYIGTTPLLYPEALKTPIVYYATTSVFALAFLLFLVKTACDIWRGRPHYPKWLLMGTTIGLALLMTSYSGARLEIAFQGLNT
ncbi:MAG: hypothetical protein FJZ47_06300, partial [Candidatus Tectomicrobia bacterium]|nr:hypothetical protein [Candidatus Tectomicrobia bacterium]